MKNELSKKMNNIIRRYKVAILLFLFLAIVISLFPPFETIVSNYGIYSHDYTFLFNEEFINTDGQVKIQLIISELLVEYFLAGLITVLFQIVYITIKDKRKNVK